MTGLSVAFRQSLPRPAREARSRLAAIRSLDRGRLHVPPPAAKRRHLLELFTTTGHRLFVESGTYLGDTSAFFAPHADRVVSVEIDPDLAAKARARFAATPNVEIVLGDAQTAIPEILREHGAPAFVWLDGHYSGEGTGRGDSDEPAVDIIRRLGEIETVSGSTIVVDDLRTFGRVPGVPNLPDLVIAARSAFPAAEVVAGLDCLVIQA
jgi:hypothetical protein